MAKSWSSRDDEVGREGFEPSTLGLRAQPEQLRKATRSRNLLQRARSDTAANRCEMRRAETSPYSHSYSHVQSSRGSRSAGPARPHTVAAYPLPTNWEAEMFKRLLQILRIKRYFRKRK